MILFLGIVIIIFVVVVCNYNSGILMAQRTAVSAAGANIPHQPVLPLNIGNYADYLFIIGAPFLGIMFVCQYILLAQIRDKLQK